MKLVKKPLALVLAVIMIMAVLVVPAFAAGSAWVTRFQKFATTSVNSYQAGYASAVQSILLRYSGTSSMISSSGGVDGIFGTNTKNAVVVFQKAKSLTADGIVGSDTWGAMATAMSESASGSTTDLLMGTKIAITAIYDNSVYNFYYRTTSGGLGGRFATTY